MAALEVRSPFKTPCLISRQVSNGCLRPWGTVASERWWTSSFSSFSSFSSSSSSSSSSCSFPSSPSVAAIARKSLSIGITTRGTFPQIAEIYCRTSSWNLDGFFFEIPVRELPSSRRGRGRGSYQMRPRSTGKKSPRFSPIEIEMSGTMRALSTLSRLSTVSRRTDAIAWCLSSSRAMSAAGDDDHLHRRSIGSSVATQSTTMSGDRSISSCCFCIDGNCARWWSGGAAAAAAATTPGRARLLRLRSSARCRRSRRTRLLLRSSGSESGSRSACQVSPYISDSGGTGPSSSSSSTWLHRDRCGRASAIAIADVIARLRGAPSCGRRIWRSSSSSPWRRNLARSPEGGSSTSSSFSTSSSSSSSSSSAGPSPFTEMYHIPPTKGRGIISPPSSPCPVEDQREQCSFPEDDGEQGYPASKEEGNREGSICRLVSETLRLISLPVENNWGREKHQGGGGGGEGGGGEGGGGGGEKVAEKSNEDRDREIRLPEVESVLQMLKERWREEEKREGKAQERGKKRGPGHVYLVGTGPGDPELLTVKALRLMQSADLVLYDRLVSTDIIDLVHPGARLLYVGKTSGFHSRSQDEIHELLLAFAEAGATVLRLKGGDPLVFGRGGEEMDFLEHEGIRVEIVPGITAASGISAALGIPLTHRGLATSVRLLTGHSRDGGQDPLFIAENAGDIDTTLVIYMGLGTLPALVCKLISGGLPGSTPSVAVERGTTPQERVVFAPVVDLPKAVEEAKLVSPTLIVIGRVVALSHLWSDGHVVVINNHTVQSSSVSASSLAEKGSVQKDSTSHDVCEGSSSSA
ncbi:hypothetical protein CBR_g4488 [Chara braunii]|uniref:uroporphyrinogen-III C-methyltransferase n=1 Tax=Chara braunii TaxID=69332 RepID=A0A388KI25_CHABU|nr:hypothetical protein CBR_g4488 [Chara braunii]|eukprot:GBG69658.1 hypothetical protein CBR_g4488 [Chara braunii]